jgi:uncharacterized membrane protein required for colicin V production
MIISAALDILAVLLILLPIARGFAKGFKRRVFSLLSLAVSAIVAYTASGILAEPLYERFLSDRVLSLCTQAAESFDPVSGICEELENAGIYVGQEDMRSALISNGGISGAVSQAAQQYGASEEQVTQIRQSVTQKLQSQLPDAVSQTLPEQLRGFANLDFSDAQINDAAVAYAQSADDAAEYIESSFIAPICKATVRLVLFLIIMAATSAVMALAFRIFGFDFAKGASGFVDRLGGAALGAVAAAANIAILCAAVSAAELSSDGLFSAASLDSKIFLPLYNMIY